MTQEQKARAYDEAKYIMKEYLESGNAGVIAENTIRKAFPELVEPEDERIRKELLQIAKESEDSFYMVMTPDKRKHLIAWLEKQGEQNLAEWNEDDEEMFNEIILDLKALKNRDTGEAGKAAYQREIDWLESLRPHSQWRPSEEQMMAIDTAINVLGKGTLSGKQLIELQEDLKKLK